MELADLLLPVLLGCLGAAAGWLAGAWATSRRARREQGLLEIELRRQIAQRDSELSLSRENFSRAESARAGAEAKSAAFEKLWEEQRLAHERNLRDLKEGQERALSDLRQAFKALSMEALKETQPEFLRLANETLAKFQESAKGDLTQRQKSIETLVKPLEEQLKMYQQRLSQSETSQSAALGDLNRHLKLMTDQSQVLSSETVQLRRVLGSSQARGRWGEETLRRVVEAAGMSPHCDFIEQAISGDAKPDLIVRLPGDRMIIVDAKVPDLQFLEEIEGGDASGRADALSRHAAKLRGTIRGLAEREYPRNFPQALDHVILFLPAESLFSAALEGDKELLVWAAGRKILLATPASLIGLLRTISLCWQQHAQAENARAISEAAQELYLRVCKFTEHLERVRLGLERAGMAFNEAVGSYERSVRPSGERLLKLGGGLPGKPMAALEELDGGLRLARGTHPPAGTPENPSC